MLWEGGAVWAGGGPRLGLGQAVFVETGRCEARHLFGWATEVGIHDGRMKSGHTEARKLEGLSG